MIGIMNYFKKHFYFSIFVTFNEGPIYTGRGTDHQYTAQGICHLTGSHVSPTPRSRKNVAGSTPEVPLGCQQRFSSSWGDLSWLLVPQISFASVICLQGLTISNVIVVHLLSSPSGISVDEYTLISYPNPHEWPFGWFLPIMKSAAMSILVHSRCDLCTFNLTITVEVRVLQRNRIKSVCVCVCAMDHEEILS